MMKDFTLSETFLAKSAWEKVLTYVGCRVKHYHAYNGRFSDIGFLSAINSKNQNITFCGVGTHHQNCIVEHKNKILTQGVITLLLHGMRMWPQMIDQMFCSFVFRAVA